MDQFRNWVISNWVTTTAFLLLIFNLAAALMSSKSQLWIGALGLLLFWALAIVFILIFRSRYLPFILFGIDFVATAFFYRLAERDRSTGERHDWAGLVSISYCAQVLLDVRSLLFGSHGELAAIVAANVFFLFAILMNMLPSLAYIFTSRLILIDSHSTKKIT